jgi:hypothetical protein
VLISVSDQSAGPGGGNDHLEVYRSGAPKASMLPMILPKARTSSRALSLEIPENFQTSISGSMMAKVSPITTKRQSAK